jgi:hypothetical protein
MRPLVPAITSRIDSVRRKELDLLLRAYFSRASDPTLNQVRLLAEVN